MRMYISSACGHEFTVYVIHEIVKAVCHEVLRLPLYHCELNPIEMAWAQVKGYIRVHNTKFILSYTRKRVYICWVCSSWIRRME